MKKIFLTLAVAGCCAFVAQQAQAVNGFITFSGTAHASGASGAGTTTITFTSPWSVTAVGGDYSGVPTTTTNPPTPPSPGVTMNSVSFTGDGSSATLNNPGIQWSFMYNSVTYNFDLTSLTFASVSGSSTTPGNVDLTGLGTACIGTDCSSASWNLVGSSTKVFTFKFRNITSTTNAVPDCGSAVALLGIALAGIEGLRRKLGARKA
jgi:hypothetical protein